MKIHVHVRRLLVQCAYVQCIYSTDQITVVHNVSLSNHSYQSGFIIIYVRTCSKSQEKSEYDSCMQ